VLQPPRRSYERPVRSRRESYFEEETLNEDETCNKKRGKRSKKAMVEVSSTNIFICVIECLPV
jgi:hypothetical protein